jgi:serine/threonine protein kinase
MYLTISTPFSPFRSSTSIIYRDIKPQNIGSDIRGVFKLFDFGLAKELKDKDLVAPPDFFDATGACGSRRYMSPEVLLCKEYGLSADGGCFFIVVCMWSW